MRVANGRAGPAARRRLGGRRRRRRPALLQAFNRRAAKRRGDARDRRHQGDGRPAVGATRRRRPRPGARRAGHARASSASRCSATGCWSSPPTTIRCSRTWPRCGRCATRSGSSTRPGPTRCPTSAACSPASASPRDHVACSRRRRPPGQRPPEAASRRRSSNCGTVIRTPSASPRGRRHADREAVARQHAAGRPPLGDRRPAAAVPGHPRRHPGDVPGRWRRGGGRSSVLRDDWGLGVEGRAAPEQEDLDVLHRSPTPSVSACRRSATGGSPAIVGPVRRRRARSTRWPSAAPRRRVRCVSEESGRSAMVTASSSSIRSTGRPTPAEASPGSPRRCASSMTTGRPSPSSPTRRQVSDRRRSRSGAWVGERRLMASGRSSLEAVVGISGLPAGGRLGMVAVPCPRRRRPRPWLRRRRSSRRVGRHERRRPWRWDYLGGVLLCSEAGRVATPSSGTSSRSTHRPAHSRRRGNAGLVEELLDYRRSA